MRKIVVLMVLALLVLGLLSPGILYVWGLSVAESRPHPDVGCPLDEAQLVETWNEFHEEGPYAEVEVLNPWSFITRAYFVTDFNEFRGYRLAAFVSDRYVGRKAPGRPMEHLISRISLAIWITRNWSGQQILCRAAQEIYASPKT